MNRYPPLAEHGLVGDLQTAALVSSDGTIDWWCTPRFDSPSVFASLLDIERGGHCRLATEFPDGDDMTLRQLYLSDTAILVTRFMAPGEVGEVADFMVPNNSANPMSVHQLVRVVRVIRGSLPFALSCQPRFDYGRAAAHPPELPHRHARTWKESPAIWTRVAPSGCPGCAPAPTRAAGRTS